MKSWVLSKTVTHPKMKAPVVSTLVLVGSLAKVVSKLKLSGEYACQLKKYGFYSFKDSKGGTVTIELKEQVIQ
jgi:hypothetical protein